MNIRDKAHIRKRGGRWTSATDVSRMYDVRDAARSAAVAASWVASYNINGYAPRAYGRHMYDFDAGNFTYQD